MKKKPVHGTNCFSLKKDTLRFGGGYFYCRTYGAARPAAPAVFRNKKAPGVKPNFGPAEVFSAERTRT